MRTLTISRLVFCVACVVGLMVAYASTAPGATGLPSLVGADWVPIGQGACCGGRTYDQCPRGHFYPGGPLMYCQGPGLYVCTPGPYFGDDGCQPASDNTVCTGVAQCYVYHAHCPGAE